MQERLIASVLVPAQTRPQQKNQAVLDSGGGGAILFGIFAFLVLAVALGMRQSKQEEQEKQDSSDLALASTYAEKEVVEIQNNQQQAAIDREKLGAQIAAGWMQDNLAKIKQHRIALYEEFSNTITEDQYGNQDSSTWMHV